MLRTLVEMYTHLSATVDWPTQVWEHSLAQHRALVAAIAAHDPRHARDLMAEHLDFSELTNLERRRAAARAESR